MIALYCRVSTREQSLEGYSIGEQQERLKNYCAAMNWKNFKLYVDGGFSGGTMERPALKNLISDIKRGLVEKVVVYKLDRLSRSQKDTLILIEDIFLSNGVDFVSMCENFDTGSPFGRAMVGILSVFAQLEREQIKERMSMGREGRAKEGYFHGGGWNPHGYIYSNGELVVNEFEKIQIQELFERFASGEVLYKIVSDFEERGYTLNGTSWTNVLAQRILENVLYIGKVKFDKKIYDGKHEPIVNLETFDKCQIQLEKMRSSTAAKNGRTNYRGTSLLSGLLFCARCGARYQLDRQKKNGVIYEYYTCASRRKRDKKSIKDPNCTNKGFRMKELDRVILSEIEKLSLDSESFLRPEKNSQKKASEKQQAIKKEIAKIDSQRERLLDLYTLGEFSFDEINSKAAALNEQKKKLKNELQNDNENVPKLTRKEALEIMSKLSELTASESLKERRELVQALIDKILIDGENIRIYWRF